MKSQWQHRLENASALIILLIAVFVLFIPEGNEYFENFIKYAPQAMFTLLFLSFVFLVLDQKTLMIVGLLSTATIAFHLKNSSNTELVLPDNNGQQRIDLLMVELDQMQNDKSAVLQLIDQSNPDVIVFQNFTDSWHTQLKIDLFKNYPHSHIIKAEDNTGMGLFSRRKIFRIENFYHYGKSNLKVVLDNLDSKVTLLASNVPESSLDGKTDYASHLQSLVNEIDNSRHPVIVMGIFNKMYWSNEMVNFMKKANLSNSRRSVKIGHLNPDDHIFFGNQLECTRFQELKNSDNSHVALFGSYQKKK